MDSGSLAASSSCRRSCCLSRRILPALTGRSRLRPLQRGFGRVFRSVYQTRVSLPHSTRHQAQGLPEQVKGMQGAAPGEVGDAEALPRKPREPRATRACRRLSPGWDLPSHRAAGQAVGTAGHRSQGECNRLRKRRRTFSRAAAGAAEQSGSVLSWAALGLMRPRVRLALRRARRSSELRESPEPGGERRGKEDAPSAHGEVRPCL